MYNTNQFFSGDPIGEGRKCLAKCVLFAGIVIIGWVIGQLTAVCIGVMLAFLIAQGLLPYSRFAKSIQDDMQGCQQEKKLLQGIPAECADEVAVMETNNSSSACKLVSAVLEEKDRQEQREKADAMLEVAEQEWEAAIAPVKLCAEQMVSLGLAGSLIGLLSGISKLSVAFGGKDPAAMQPAFAGMMAGMKAMIATTIVGCLSAFLMLWLAAIAEKYVRQHIAELRMLARLIVGEEEADENVHNLFTKGE